MKILIILYLFSLNIMIAEDSLEAIIEMVNSKEYGKATILIDEYLEDNSKDDNAYFIKTLILVSQENYTDGMEFISKAIQLNDSNPDYYRMQAQIYEELDDEGNAILAWNNCLKYSINATMTDEANNHIRHLEAE